MNNNDLKYIISNIKHSQMNIYKNITTLNTMRQYLNLVKREEFNYEEAIGKGNQKAVILKRIDGTVIGEIKDMKYPGNSEISLDIVRDKLKTEELLIHAEVNTTNSKVYNESSLKRAIKEFYDSEDKLAVIKPTNMSQGKGVNVGIKKQDFEYYWNDTLSQIKIAGRRNVEVIVQDYLEGFEARAVVIKGKLISIVARVPAYVVGNGIDSIKKLVYKKNIMRKNCAHLRKRPIVMDQKKKKFLSQENMNFSTIPRKGESVLLSSISNISNGGEMIDITDMVSEEIKKIALKSIAAIPGMYSGGVDIMMRNFEDTKPRVIEINAWPMLQSTIYPTYGKSYDPQGYFLNAFYALDQFINQPKRMYNIENAEVFVRNYMGFQALKNEIQTKQIINNLNDKF